MGLLSWQKKRKMPKQPEVGVLAYQTAIKMLKEGKIDTQNAWATVLAGLKYSDLSDKGKKDCVDILSDYHQQWLSANPSKQAEIEWRVNEFKLYLEDGCSPQEGRELASQADYTVAQKWQNVFKYFREAYMAQGMAKEEADSKISQCQLWGGSLWIEVFQTLTNYHKHRYYMLNSPVISDAEYDWLKQQLNEVKAATDERTRQSK